MSTTVVERGHVHHMVKKFSSLSPIEAVKSVEYDVSIARISPEMKNVSYVFLSPGKDAVFFDHIPPELKDVSIARISPEMMAEMQNKSEKKVLQKKNVDRKVKKTSHKPKATKLKKKQEKVDREKKNKGSKKPSKPKVDVAPTKAYSYKKEFNLYEEPVSYPNKPNPKLNAEVESIFSKYMIDTGRDGHGHPRIPKEYREAAFREAYEYALKNYKGEPFRVGKRRGKVDRFFKDLVKYWREEALWKDYKPRVLTFIHDHVPAQSRYEAIQHSYKLGKNKKHINPEDLNNVNIPQHFEYWRIMDPVEYPKFAREMGDVNSKEYKDRQRMTIGEIKTRNEKLLREKELRLDEEFKNRMRLDDEQFYGGLHDAFSKRFGLH